MSKAIEIHYGRRTGGVAKGKSLGPLSWFGRSSGPIAAFDPSVLMARGSLFLTRPSFMDYTADRKDLFDHAADLFEVIRFCAVRVPINHHFPLADAARVDQELESRAITSASVLFA